jgi:polar amino acid transport system substrate-binding protein
MTYPPYESFQGTDPSGFDPEFIAEIAKRLDLKARFIDTRFPSLILGLTGHRYDMIASALYMTSARAKVVNFIPYFVTGGAIMANAATSFRPKTMADLCGKRVGSLQGAAWVPLLHEVSEKTCLPEGKGPIQVHEFDTSSEAAEALASRAVDAQYDDAGVAKMIVEKLRGRIVITSRKALHPVVCGLAFRKDDNQLMSKVQQAFNAIKRDGQYQALLKKFNLKAPSEEQAAASLSAPKE